MKYIRILISYLQGLLYAFALHFLRLHRLSPSADSPHVVVTLTSYGRRARAVLPHTLRSLLRQHTAPDRIIVWLDDDHFSSDTLPSALCRLRDRYGVEFRFCADIRSYKKLVPTLALCPDDLLITVDDDFVYLPTLVSSLLEAHRRHPADVICTLAHRPLTDADGRLLPYKRWQMNLTQPYDGPIFPLGGAGTLYPPHSLHADVTDAELFTALAPTADDVWFCFSALAAGTPHRLAGCGRQFHYVDLAYEYLHAHSSLKSTNVDEGRNDAQIRAVMEHYHLSSF